MTRFTTFEQESLGVTFCGDCGRTVFQSQEELRLMWSLIQDDEETLIISSDGMELTVGEMQDWFRDSCTRCSEEELTRRFGDRTESGLGFRNQVSESGDLITTR